MSTISGISSSGDPWANMKAQRSQMQAKMFAKVDTDSSGGVDKTELQNLLNDVAKKTGASNSSSADALFSKMDTNGDGSLSSDELGKGMKDIMPPPSTMDFAQSRNNSTTTSTSGTTGSGDDLFGKVDTDGNGSISKEEMQSLRNLMDKLASTSSTDSTSSTTASSTSATSSSSNDDMFAKLDANGDGSLSKAEFEAGRPQGSQGPQGAGGAPPPPADGTGSSSASSSTTYDPLDTNKDGVVSAQERLAGNSSSSSTDAVQTLIKAIDVNSDDKISSSESDTFIKKLSSQLDALTQSTQNSGTSTASTSNNDNLDLVNLVRQAYEQIASGLSQQAKGSTLSTMA